MRRIALLTLILLALAPAAAFGQAAPGSSPSAGGGSNAFGPLPSAQPAETPAPEKPKDPTDPGFGRTTLYIIFGFVFVGLVTVGFVIARDARRNAPAEVHAGPTLEEQRAHKKRSKQHRNKQKAARKARKRTARSR